MFTLQMEQNQDFLERLQSIENNEFYLQEKLILDYSKVKTYYKHIINNIDIDRSNPNNSYIMWLYLKVDQVDTNKPAKINPGRVSLPDIDCDFPISRREEVLGYMRDKYGHDKVCQMITFTRMQGRGAVKDVLRMHETCSYEEMNRITEYIPDEAEIADQLQLMREARGEASIIQWALENNSEYLKEWCFINKDGELEGPLAVRFAQAMRLEGTKRSSGKHAAGVVISPVPLNEVCPLLYDKTSKEQIAALEMNDLEKLGLVKYDILGVAVLDKIAGVENLLNTGSINGR